MARDLIVGPLLGLEGENAYTFCFLTSDSAKSAEVMVGGVTVAAENLVDIPGGRFWRAESNVPVPNGSNGTHVDYAVTVDGRAAVVKTSR